MTHNIFQSISYGLYNFSCFLRVLNYLLSIKKVISSMTKLMVAPVYRIFLLSNDDDKVDIHKASNIILDSILPLKKSIMKDVREIILRIMFKILLKVFFIRKFNVIFLVLTLSRQWVYSLYPPFFQSHKVYTPISNTTIFHSYWC